MRYGLLILLALLAACSAEALFDKMSTPQERTMALQAANALIASDFPKFDDVMDVSLRDDMTAEVMAKMKPMMPKGKPDLKTIFMQTSDGVSMKSFNYEAGSGDRWAIIQITLRTAPGPLVVVGYRVYPADRSPSGAVAFSVAKASALEYFWITMMALAVVTSLVGFVQVIRTRGVKLKWLWAIGCLFSFVTFWLQAGGGSFGIQPIAFQLLGAGFMQSDPFSPMVLSFSIPIVAIVFLIRKARGIYTPDPEDDAEAFI